MSEVRFELREKGVEELVKSREMEAKLQEIVDGLCEKANDTLEPDREDPGYMCAVDKSREDGEPRGHVWAQGLYSKRSNALHQTLVKLLYG